MLVLMYVEMRCVLQQCKTYGNSYEEYKKHKLRQKVESGSYLKSSLSQIEVI